MSYHLECGYLDDAVARGLRRKVRGLMRTCADEYDNPTRLAEAAAAAFDLYGPAPDYTIPEDLFEWALDFYPE